MLRIKTIIVGLTLTFCFSTLLSAQEQTPLQVPKASGLIMVDGFLQEEAWDNALKIEIPYEIFPGENSPASVKTYIYITYDHEFLYVAFRAEDPDPVSLRANYRDRDNLDGDDYVGFEIDTFNDEKSSFSFQVNPLGIQADSSYNETGSGGGENWDAIWESEGQLTEWGYAVEMKIPFAVIRFPDSGEKMIWGLFASRNYPRDVVYGFRNTKLDRGRNCEMCQSQKIVGFEGVKPGQNIEIAPTFSAISLGSRDPFPNGEMREVDSTSDFGVSGTWGVTPNSTLSAAINPDFSQIEADSLELDINRQFAIYYDEKRAFFLEGDEFFKGLHTRTIADPQWGAKYTLRQGKNSLGFISARDRITNLVFPGAEGSDQTSLDQENVASSIRYSRDIWNRSTVGAVFTDRRGGDYKNNLFGLDGTIKIGNHDSLVFDLRHTRTQYGDDLAAEFGQPLNEFSGNALSLAYEHGTRSWSHAASYEEFDENYRADMDQVSQVGYRSLYLGAGPVWWGGKDDLLKRLSWSVDYNLQERKDGRMLLRSLASSVIAQMPMQSLLFFGLHKNRSWFAGDRYDLAGGHFMAGVKPLPYLRFSGGVRYAEAIDYLGRRPGKQLVLSHLTFLDLGKHLHLETRYVYTNFQVSGERLFLTNTLEGKFIWQINTNTYLRMILQFADIRRNQEMYSIAVNDINRKIFGQLLFSYKLNPRTVLYLGYNSNSRGTEDIGLTQDSQMLFFKVGYAFLM